MISVSNVSMRYGAKILFEDVSTAFTPGKRYGLTGPNGSGKSTFMKLLTGELDAAKGQRRSPAQIRRPAARTSLPSTPIACIDTVIMGNKRLWAALRRARPHLRQA